MTDKQQKELIALLKEARSIIRATGKGLGQPSDTSTEGRKMSDKRQSDALHLADIADDGAWTFVIGVRKEIAAELRRQHIELETLRTGYAAARLEVGSLQFRLADQGRVLEKVVHGLMQSRRPTNGEQTTTYEAKHCAKRDHEAQDTYYVNHVSTMTGEGLHAKSAIAAELATRLRNACASVRYKSYPLADLIPLMQQAANALAGPAMPVAELVTTAHGFETKLSLLPGHFDLPYGTHLLYAVSQLEAQALDAGQPIETAPSKEQHHD